MGIKYYETPQYISYVFNVKDIKMSKVKDEITCKIDTVKGILVYSSLELIGKIFANKSNGKKKISIDVKNHVEFYITTPFMTLSSSIINFRGEKIFMSKYDFISDGSANFSLNFKSPNNRVFEPVIEQIKLKGVLKKQESI